MGQSHLKVAALATAAALALLASRSLASGGVPPTQKPPVAELVNPFRLMKDEMKAGNPLAQYLEQLRLEKEYLADEKWKSGYFQARATTVSFLGDTFAADRDWDLGVPNPSFSQVLIASPLAAMRAESAVDVIVRAADRHRWIMLGEEHVKPQTRSILIPLLRRLYKRGFRTLAAETFNSDIERLVRQTPYPTYGTGTYTADPVFAAGVREAIRLGFRLVPYEAEEQPKDIPANDPEFAQNFRENLQAKNLKERIYDRDPKAKVIVWAGRAHVLETANKGHEDSEWRPMAYEFKRMTGEDPFSVYLATYAESSERRFEWPLYKWATDRGLVSRPTIFVGKDGKPFGELFDAQVFFPRTTIVEGRPDWLVREMGRRAVSIPAKLVKATGMQLAQAFVGNEPVTAVPIDQVLIRPGEPVPSLMLPPGSMIRVRVLGAAGKVSEWAGVFVR